MSADCYAYHVGQFWRPHLVSPRKVKRVLARALPRFVGKPRVRLFNNPGYGPFLFVWGERR